MTIFFFNAVFFRKQQIRTIAKEIDILKSLTKIPIFARVITVELPFGSNINKRIPGKFMKRSSNTNRPPEIRSGPVRPLSHEGLLEMTSIEDTSVRLPLSICQKLRYE